LTKKERLLSSLPGSNRFFFCRFNLSVKQPCQRVGL